MIDLKTCLMFVSQPLLDTLESKKILKDTDFVLSWKSKSSYNSKFKPLYTSLHSIKISEY